jgi:sec-independent protein translocase protein TatC
MTDGRRGPLIGHLEELRSRIVKASLAVVGGTVIAFVFRRQIFDLIIAPYAAVPGVDDLVFFKPTEAFALYMRLALFGGLVLASPVILFQLWRFVAPALSRRERRAVIPVVAVLTVLFLGGIAFGYWILEYGLEFLLGFGGDQLTPVIGGNEYVSFAVQFLLVFGLAFEFPVFLYLAAMVGALTWQRLARARRGALVTILVVSAVVTPGDVFTMMAMAVPVYAMYEITILLIRLTIRR